MARRAQQSRAAHHDEYAHLSHHGDQEADRENACTSWLSPFSPFILSRSPVCGMVIPTLRAGLSIYLMLSGNALRHA
jgi:hypothetical protein